MAVYVIQVVTFWGMTALFLPIIVQEPGKSGKQANPFKFSSEPSSITFSGYDSIIPGVSVPNVLLQIVEGKPVICEPLD